MPASSDQLVSDRRLTAELPFLGSACSQAAMQHEQDYERVLRFWFGDDATGAVSPEIVARWWTKSEAFDATVRELFLADHEAIHQGKREAWLATPRGRLAHVIVLDQFSRNMFRGTAQMFASDKRALLAALACIEAGDPAALRAAERGFLYLPLMHSEELAMQDRCVELYRAEGEGAASSYAFAVQHRDIVARFGRFPHRNALLGRSSTPAEEAFLQEPGSSF